MILGFTILSDNVGTTGLIGLINNYTSRTLGQFRSSSSLIIAITAACIFMGVVQVKPHYNKKINVVGSMIFGVYLFHETFFYFMGEKRFALVDILYSQCQNVGFITKNILYPVQIIIFAIMILLAGILVEGIRKKLLHKPFLKLLDKYCSNYLENIDKFFDMTDK